MTIDSHLTPAQKFLSLFLSDSSGEKISSSRDSNVGPMVRDRFVEPGVTPTAVILIMPAPKPMSRNKFSYWVRSCDTRALACLGCSGVRARACPGGCAAANGGWRPTRRSSWTVDDFGVVERGCGCHSKSNSVSLFHVSFLNSSRRRRPQSTQPTRPQILGHFSITVFDFLNFFYFTRQESRRCFPRSSIPPASTRQPSSAATANLWYKRNTNYKDKTRSFEIQDGLRFGSHWPLLNRKSTTISFESVKATPTWCQWQLPNLTQLDSTSWLQLLAIFPHSSQTKPKLPRCQSTSWTRPGSTEQDPFATRLNSAPTKDERPLGPHRSLLRRNKSRRRFTDGERTDAKRRRRRRRHRSRRTLEYRKN